MAFFRQRTLYVRFDDRASTLVDLTTGARSTVAAVVALEDRGGQRVVAAVGEDALSRRDCEQVWPFSHERIVLSDFEVAQALLRHQILQTISSRTMRRPRIILHPLRRLSTDLTDVEVRALLDLAMSAGASWTAVHVGPEITPETLPTTAFPWTTSAGRAS